MNRYILISIVFVALLCRCSSDTFEPSVACEEIVTYQDVRNIIISNCSQSGCHDGTSGVGNYSTYRGIESTLLDGSFDDEMFISRSMPPEGFEITSEEFDLLKCWSDNNFPQ